ncbi:MAG: hypothetical protein ABS93_00500 [Thiobacillus sp. SCN 62-729]|nr:MAG: hypothetical protein ABS93_00500 [Thiobacillus sp. SCN 62-729]
MPRQAGNRLQSSGLRQSKDSPQFHGSTEYSFLVIAIASEVLREAIQNAGKIIERWIAAAL